jgi:hypothetical protein
MTLAAALRFNVARIVQMQERLTERDGKIEIPNYPFGTDP